MRKLSALMLSALLLASCGEETASAPGSRPVSETTSVTSVSEKQTVTEPAKPVQFREIEAEVTGINEDMLSFSFEGRDYGLKLDSSQVEPRSYGKYEQTLCEKVICNPYGIKIRAKLLVDEDMTRIKEFDPYSLNGRLIEGFGTLMPGAGEDKDKSYHFKRTGGSLCELTNSEETLSCDLNDLPMIFKMDYPEECELRAFKAFEFTGGPCILYQLSMFEFDEPSKWETFNKQNGFYATVRSVTDGKAAVLLNDGRTLCTVPTYYNDGEVKEGAQVMIILDEDTSLFGSGTDREYGFAVIYTDPEVFHHSALSFAETAWATRTFTSLDSYAYTYLKDTRMTGHE